RAGHSCGSRYRGTIPGRTWRPCWGLSVPSCRPQRGEGTEGGSGMARYLLGRLAGLILVVLALTVFTFGLMHSVPGGPFVFAKQPLPPFAMENINRKYGLDQPVYVQYGRWLWAVLHFDFGVPFQSPTETVLGLIQRAWPVTLLVGVLTLAVAYGLGILAGVVA